MRPHLSLDVRNVSASVQFYQLRYQGQQRRVRADDLRDMRKEQYRMNTNSGGR
jgi:hypothetical protein